MEGRLGHLLLKQKFGTQGFYEKDKCSSRKIKMKIRMNMMIRT